MLYLVSVSCDFSYLAVLLSLLMFCFLPLSVNILSYVAFCLLLQGQSRSESHSVRGSAESVASPYTGCDP